MDDTIHNLSMLKEENKDLRFEIEQQHDIIESQKQDLHNVNRKLETLNKMKIEMEIEIDALTGLHQIKGSLETKIKNLEAELSDAKSKFDIVEAELQTEKSNHKLEIWELTTELNNYRKDREDERTDTEQKELCAKLLSLQETNESLMSDYVALQEYNKNLTEKTLKLESTIEEKNQELEEMKSILDNKSKELESTLELVDKLQCEKAILNAELMSTKNTSNEVNNKRGNSLFAEVEDKRQSTTNKYEALQQKYKELKKTFLKKNAELRALEEENNKLRKEWKEDESAPSKSMGAYVESQKIRIQELMQMVSFLERRPESPQIISISEVTNKHVECIKEMVESERKSVRQLTQELEERSIRQHALGEELLNVNREKRRLKAQNMKDTATIAELKFRLEQIEKVRSSSS